MRDQVSDGGASRQALNQGSSPGVGVSAAAAAPAPEASAGSANIEANPIPQGAERRRSQRFKCEGSAEMVEEGTEVRTWATFKDISMHGCYVEATATYPVGTKLQVKLAANGFQVSAKGTVRVNYPYLGMGIAFGEMSADDHTRLKNLVHTLARPSIVMGEGLSCSSPGAHTIESVPLISDAAVAIQAMIKFFENQQTLRRDEFLRLLHDSQSGSKG